MNEPFDIEQFTSPSDSLLISTATLKDIRDAIITPLVLALNSPRIDSVEIARAIDRIVISGIYSGEKTDKMMAEVKGDSASIDPQIEAAYNQAKTDSETSVLETRLTDVEGD